MTLSGGQNNTVCMTLAPVNCTPSPDALSIPDPGAAYPTKSSPRTLMEIQSAGFKLAFYTSSYGAANLPSL